jgi:DNA-binding FadR family transcriptional regulator
VISGGLQPVGRSNSPAAVSAEILRLIRAGQLAPGDQLPAEREFAAALEVSRTAFREGLKALVAAGVLTIVHGKGTFVNARPSATAMQAPLSSALLLGQIDVAQLVEARSITEGETAAMAAERMGPDDAAELRRLLGAMARTDDPELFIELDRDFHQAIAGGTGNQVLVLMLQAVRDLVQDAWLQSARDPERRDQTRHEHALIVQAIERADPESARRAMLEHLSRTRAVIERLAAEARAPEEVNPKGRIR